MWHITIDHIAQSGGKQRYESEIDDVRLGDAIETSLIWHRLEDIELGQYQITATSMEHDR